jgi:MFS family permease
VTATASPPDSTAAQPERSRWVALVVLCVGVLMIVLDATIVNVALPSIQSDLGFSQADLAWVVNAYLIAFGGLLLLAGRLGDLISRRGIFLAGLGVFTVASLLCGSAQSQEMLVAARFVQGVGGAMTSAVVLGMIVTMFPEPREQAKAIGVYSFVASAGGSIGLLAGGVLTQAINWHWIFFVNVPIGIATAVAARRLLAKDRGIGFGQGADVLGAALITGALMLLVYTIVKPAAEDGWTAARTLGFGAVAVALLYLQRVLGYDPLEIGLAFLPTTIVMGGLSLFYAGKLITRFGARRTLVPGLVLILAGQLLFTRAPVDASYVVDVLPVMLLIGTGVALCFPALMTLSMSGATPSDAGLASGLVNTTVQVGGALGLAVLATLAATETEGLRATGHSAAAALNGGYHLAYLVGAGLVLVAIGVAFAVLQSERRPARARLRIGRAKPAYSESA